MLVRVAFIILIIIGLILLTKWTDKKGWTSFYERGTSGAMLYGVMSTIDEIMLQKRKPAIEIQREREERAEQQESGDVEEANPKQSETF